MIKTQKEICLKNLVVNDMIIMGFMWRKILSNNKYISLPGSGVDR